jgi:hypothetical protein
MLRYLLDPQYREQFNSFIRTRHAAFQELSQLYEENDLQFIRGDESPSQGTTSFHSETSSNKNGKDLPFQNEVLLLNPEAIIARYGILEKSIGLGALYFLAVGAAAKVKKLPRTFPSILYDISIASFVGHCGYVQFSSDDTFKSLEKRILAPGTDRLTDSTCAALEKHFLMVPKEFWKQDHGILSHIWRVQQCHHLLEDTRKRHACQVALRADAVFPITKEEIEILWMGVSALYDRILVHHGLMNEEQVETWVRDQEAQLEHTRILTLWETMCSFQTFYALFFEHFNRMIKSQEEHDLAADNRGLILFLVASSMDAAKDDFLAKKGYHPRHLFASWEMHKKNKWTVYPCFWVQSKILSELRRLMSEHGIKDTTG